MRSPRKSLLLALLLLTPLAVLLAFVPASGETGTKASPALNIIASRSSAVKAPRRAVSFPAKAGAADPVIDGWSVLESQLVLKSTYKDATPQPRWLLGGWSSKCDIFGDEYSACLHLLKREKAGLHSGLLFDQNVQLQLAADSIENMRFAHRSENVRSAQGDAANQFVIYNKPARDTLRNSGAFDPANWQKVFDGTAASPFQDRGFPKDAVIVKGEFRQLSVPTPCLSSSNPVSSDDQRFRCSVTLPAAMPEDGAPAPPSPLGVPATPALGQVVVDLNLHPARLCTLRPVEVQNVYTIGPSTQIADLQQDSRTVVPLSCFHFFVLHKQQAGVQLLPETSNQLFAHGQYQPGDNIVFVLGFHLIRADTPEWTWTTFWWDPNPLAKAEADHCGNRRGVLVSKAPWTHYCMDMVSQPEQSLEKPAASHFNPYIEQFPGGGQSNCLHCHSRAMYRDTSKGTLGPQPGYTKSDFQQGKGLQGALIPCGQPGTKDAFCNQGLATHFLWSLADTFDNGGTVH